MPQESDDSVEPAMLWCRLSLKPLVYLVIMRTRCSTELSCLRYARKHCASDLIFNWSSLGVEWQKDVVALYHWEYWGLLIVNDSTIMFVLITGAQTFYYAKRQHSRWCHTFYLRSKCALPCRSHLLFCPTFRYSSLPISSPTFTIHHRLCIKFLCHFLQSLTPQGQNSPTFSPLPFSSLSQLNMDATAIILHSSGALANPWYKSICVVIVVFYQDLPHFLRCEFFIYMVWSKIEHE